MEKAERAQLSLACTWGTPAMPDCSLWVTEETGLGQEERNWGTVCGSESVRVFLGDEGHPVPCEGQIQPGTGCFRNAHGSLAVPLPSCSLLQLPSTRILGEMEKEEKRRGEHWWKNKRRPHPPLELMSLPARGRLSAFTPQCIKQELSTRKFLQFSPFFTAGLQSVAGWRQHNCAMWNGDVLC